MDNAFSSTARKSLMASTLVFSDNGEVTTVGITRGWRLSNEILQIERLTKEIIDSNTKLFSIDKGQYLPKNDIQTKEVGALFILAFTFDIFDIEEGQEIYRSNPYVNLFLKHIEDGKLHHFPSSFKNLQPIDKISWVAKLNNGINAIRTEARDKDFKKQLGEHRRLANKNYAGLVKYINRHFEIRSRLLFIRLDLGMAKDACWSINENKLIDYNNIKKYKDEFFKYLKKKYSEDEFVGYAWGLEYGLEKTYHYHTLLIFNGRHFRQDVSIGKMLGEHWKNDITNGNGIYHNCNAKKEGYKNCGIGMINHDDIELRNNLLTVAEYVTKLDYYIKLVTPNGDQTFRKGNMPKTRVSNKGRPRSNGITNPN